MAVKEAKTRIKNNKLLEEAKWLDLSKRDEYLKYNIYRLLWSIFSPSNVIRIKERGTSKYNYVYVYVNSYVTLNNFMQ